MKLEIEKWMINSFDNELQFQCKAIEMISYFFPKLRGFVFHVKNEVVIERKPEECVGEGDSQATKERKNKLYDERCMRMRNRWIAEGMLAGVPDIIIRYKGIMYPIELKIPGGRLSPAQKEIHEKWTNDCEQIPTQVAYTLYHIYMYCKWIVGNGFTINFQTGKGVEQLFSQFKKFEL